MKISKKIVLLLLLASFFACSFYVWWNNSSATAEYRWQAHALDTEFSLANAFATALRTNHPAAYNWIDPRLKPRLDKWMNTHQSKNCVDEPYSAFAGPDANGYYDVSFSCFGIDGEISMEIDDIVIKDMKVIDWGEVREGD